ncbi:protein phosphatase 1 regulatory subunit 16A-like [Oratosquilla oratoria]|uniref:protein phosphatase 1 regulatory subunit 16A-like n=1 Tax=Oratosquilla oratoria TaxID=337810 RepID=UPI003F775365
MDHSELISEMAYIEKLSTQERLKLARRRRMQQMKKWQQREKELAASKRDKTAMNEAQKRRRENGKCVSFIWSVMLLEAAARNDIDEVSMLLENKVDPDSTNEDGLTALHQCCIDDSEEMMRLLVRHGANINAKDSERWTPLHAAATCGHLHLAKFLTDNGADLLAVNADGNMPYDICEDDATLDYIEGEMAKRGVTQQLIDDTRAATENTMLTDLQNTKAQGLSLMTRDEHGATPLHIAAANGYMRVVEFLLSHGVPTEVRDLDDWTPLHAAACWGHPDVLETLVHHGANLQSRTKNHETPYDICEDAELRERILQLINEQETKRLQDQHRRVRRAHSNTRTQSVRRTSIREKTLTPKKEAQEEARIRMQMETNKNVLEESSATVGEEKAEAENEVAEAEIVNSDGKKAPALITQSPPNVPETCMDIEEEKQDRGREKNEFICETTIMEEEEVKRLVLVGQSKTRETSFPSSPNTDHVVCENQPPPVPPRGISSDGTSPVSAEGASKIDIHVTVTVNPYTPGTLADLKKQRAMSRASQSSYTLAPASSTYSLAPSECERGTELSASSVRVDTINFGTSSPSRLPRRFRGDPAEIIGGVDTHSCCILM